MKDADDFVRALLKMVMEVTPSFSEEQALQVEQQIRHDWGGEQVKIAKRGTTWINKKQKARELIGLKSAEELQVELGMSRSTLYRCIRKAGK